MRRQPPGSSIQASLYPHTFARSEPVFPLYKVSLRGYATLPNYLKSFPTSSGKAKRRLYPYAAPPESLSSPTVPPSAPSTESICDQTSSSSCVMEVPPAPPSTSSSSSSPVSSSSSASVTSIPVRHSANPVLFPHNPNPEPPPGGFSLVQEGMAATIHKTGGEVRLNSRTHGYIYIYYMSTNVSKGYSLERGEKEVRDILCCLTGFLSLSFSLFLFLMCVRRCSTIPCRRPIETSPSPSSSNFSLSIYMYILPFLPPLPLFNYSCSPSHLPPSPPPSPRLLPHPPPITFSPPGTSSPSALPSMRPRRRRPRPSGRRSAHIYIYIYNLRTFLFVIEGTGRYIRIVV